MGKPMTRRDVLRYGLATWAGLSFPGRPDGLSRADAAPPGDDDDQEMPITRTVPAAAFLARYEPMLDAIGCVNARSFLGVPAGCLVLRNFLHDGAWLLDGRNQPGVEAVAVIRYRFVVRRTGWGPYYAPADFSLLPWGAGLTV